MNKRWLDTNLFSLVLGVTIPAALIAKVLPVRFLVILLLFMTLTIIIAVFVLLAAGVLILFRTEAARNRAGAMAAATIGPILFSTVFVATAILSSGSKIHSYVARRVHEEATSPKEVTQSNLLNAPPDPNGSLANSKPPVAVVTFEVCATAEQDSCAFRDRAGRNHQIVVCSGVQVEILRFRFHEPHDAFRESLRALSFGSVDEYSLSAKDSEIATHATLVVYDGPSSPCHETISAQTIVGENTRRDLARVPALPFVIAGTSDPDCFIDKLASERNPLVVATCLVDTIRFDQMRDSVVAAVGAAVSQRKSVRHGVRAALIGQFDPRHLVAADSSSEHRLGD